MKGPKTLLREHGAFAYLECEACGFLARAGNFVQDDVGRILCPGECFEDYGVAAEPDGDHADHSGRCECPWCDLRRSRPVAERRAVAS